MYIQYNYTEMTCTCTVYTCTCIQYNTTWAQHADMLVTHTDLILLLKLLLCPSILGLGEGGTGDPTDLQYTITLLLQYLSQRRQNIQHLEFPNFPKNVLVTLTNIIVVFNISKTMEKGQGNKIFKHTYPLQATSYTIPICIVLHVHVYMYIYVYT